jgi:transposase-like protein
VKLSETTCKRFFKDLKSRGLIGSNVKLGIMNGLLGLERVFIEKFPEAAVQRCQVHAAHNVLAKVPKKIEERNSR